MQTKPTPRFMVLEVALLAIRALAPLIEKIRRRDRSLAEQVRDAGSSMVLNIGEGNRSQGGHRVARFSTAAGSTSEARSGLRVAEAWGYVRAGETAEVEVLLDRVAAMLHRLGARR